MTTLKLRRTVSADRRRFILFLVLIAVVSLAVMIVTLVVKQVNQPPQGPFISRDMDEVLSTVIIAITGTAIGSCLVGIMLDQYQRRFGETLDEYAAASEREGIIGVYRSAEDPDLVESLGAALSVARSEVVAVGLGLSILLNRVLLLQIAERVVAERGIRVKIILGSPHNAGVMNRVREEAAWHEQAGIAYSSEWVWHFGREIRDELKRYVGRENANRVNLIKSESCPTVGVIRVDGRIFMFAYGAPSMRGGSASPWIELDPDQGHGFLSKFANDTLAFFVDEFDARMTADSASQGADTAESLD